MSIGLTDVTQPGKAPGAAPAQVDGIHPSRLVVTLEFPVAVRAGDGGLVQLRIHPEARSESDGSLDGLPAGRAEPSLEGEDGSGSSWIQARLELDGGQVRPESDVTAAWSRAQGTKFAWTVSDLEVELARGTAWTFLVPAASSMLGGVRVALSAQTLEIRRARLLGLSGPASRLCGAGLVLLAVTMGLPGLDRGRPRRTARSESG